CEGGAYEDAFFQWQVNDFLFEAQMLATLGVIVPIVTYSWLSKATQRRLAVPMLPKVGIEVAPRTILYLSLALIVSGLGLRLLVLGSEDLADLGTLGGFLENSANIAIFLLSLAWADRVPALPRWTRWIAPVVALSEAAY